MSSGSSISEGLSLRAADLTRLCDGVWNISESDSKVFPLITQLLSADIAPETISSHFQEDWNTHSEEMAGGTRCVPADADPLMQQQSERIDVCTFFSDRATVHDPSMQANCDKWAALWTYMLGGQVHLSLDEAEARGVVGFRFGECEMTYVILRRWGAVAPAAEESEGVLAGFMTGSVET